MTAPRYFALIPAAGVGARMGGTVPKQYTRLAGKPMLARVLDTFVGISAIAHTFTVVSSGDEHIDEAMTEVTGDRSLLSILRVGGDTRRQSVLNGLHAMRGRMDVSDDDWILVHDAARPGIDAESIEKLMHAIHDDVTGGLLALPVVDTLKRADADGRIDRTIPREQLWAAQTPQMFRYGLLRHALEQAEHVTDEAGAIEALGLKPLLVEGSARNFKVTLPHDVALAELYLKEFA
ncbi:MAG TPA: 2-C-methyl-D-erythritol 4-phosphate cytidylyltransferase [Oxalicibacterium sp.]|uniref:2-C-methyl-D-erythritol 4-phosphate cytidylyltransferase n=1 Tax=Oxalicibacterium sp. TaxID=2766525 RepID=UPI002C94CA1E|nr:2-C-methyl-D-erythritol 4-phosphate cytidylyltransferase [Oxalicibacterium sp.]HWU99189.1 2-C-methyl-D-erythritol 4-phosphate cytidylyltransferase [Oxalicibacterium sp.]